MNEEIKPLVGAAIEAGAALTGIAIKALAGLIRSPEEVRQALLESTDKLAAFVRAGGEMDERRDAAREKTDKAIAEAEHE